jgi:hypothetical protein
MFNFLPMAHRKRKIQTLTHGYQDCLIPGAFQNVMSKLVQDMECVKTMVLSWKFINTNK